MKIAHLLPALLCTTLLIGACDTKNNNKKGPQSCDDIDRTQDVALLDTEKSTGEVTLSGTYRVKGRNIYDGKQEVTIEPGTVFLMEADSFLRIGWRGAPAKITAIGTAEKPILFCGTEKKPGHWDNIDLMHGTVEGSAFEHVRIEDAGSKDAALTVDTDIDLKSISVYDSGSIGMRLRNLGKGSQNLTVKNSKLQPLALKGSNAVTNLPEGDYTGNGEDVALFYGEPGLVTIFHDRGIPYRQTTERIRLGATPEKPDNITFEAGVTYQFCEGCYMETGWRGNEHTLFESLGTAEKPVIFTSASDTPTPGDWQGIYLKYGTVEGSIIQHTEFHYGGKADQANLVLNNSANIPITDSKFLNSAGYGVKLENKSFVFDPSTNTLENNTQGPTNL